MNPLAIRIAADLKAFKANMAEMRTQLETNASAMKRMSSSFDGSKVIGDANAMVKAIHDIGGASKLTESEQKRVNAAVTEALAKYKALGRDAPPELLALRDATQKVNTEAVKTPTLLDKMKSQGVAMGAAFGTFIGGMAWSAVSKLGDEVGEFMKRGSQLPALQSSFERLSAGVNANANQMLKSMQQASRGMVSEFELMKSANKAMLLGLPVTEQSMGTLTKAAVTLGRAMGLDATKSVDDFITALGRSSPMILDNLGLTVKVGEANEVYARQLGKTVEQLTDAEKKTAFYNEAMRKAAEKTQELGEQTMTLGDYMGVVWTKFGDQVTKETARANEGMGKMIASWGVLKRIITEGPESGMGAAIAPLIPTSPQQAQLKAMIPVLQATNDLTEAQTEIYRRQSQELSKAIAAQDAYNSKIQALADKFRGHSLNEEVRDLAAGVARAGGAAKLTEFEYKALGKQLAELHARGATFPIELHNIWLSHERLNPSIKITTDAYKSLAEAMKIVPGIKLGLAPPPLSLPISSDPLGILRNIERFLPKIKLSAAPVARTWVDGFTEFLGSATSGIGNSIVSAIQGGGNVVLSAIASLANSAGQYFGSQFAKAMKKDLVSGQMVREMSDAMAGILSGLTGGIIGVGVSILQDMFKPVYTALEQVAMASGKTTKQIEDQLRAMGVAGVRAFENMTSAGLSWSNMRDRIAGKKEGDALMALLGQFQTKDELNKIAEQWGGTYQYMLSSGLYTAAQLAEAWKRYQAAVTEAVGAVDPEDSRPVGARGFPTKAQLQQSVREAQEAYRYVRDSGLYTADVIEQAWQQWQDAMIASGDETAKRMKELQSEIASLQKAVEAETPEYDANGVRMYGVEEQRNIERLAALEAEKAALNLAQIEKEAHATEVAAAEASLQADKEFEAAKIRALNLDGYLKKLFSGGYEIPITFRLPSGLPGGTAGAGPSWFGGSGLGATPAPSSRPSMATILVTTVIPMDGEVVARKTVKHTAQLLPSELAFTGARR